MAARSSGLLRLLDERPVGTNPLPDPIVITRWILTGFHLKLTSKGTGVRAVQLLRHPVVRCGIDQAPTDDKPTSGHADLACRSERAWRKRLPPSPGQAGDSGLGVFRAATPQALFPAFAVSA